MKRNTKKYFSVLLCALLLIVSCMGGTVFASVPDTRSADGTATVWVVGDSTVCAFSDEYYYPRYGWGTQLSNYFDNTLTVNNLAMSGRSSKSYVSEKNYQTLIDGMQSGDYLLVGFGHNDEKAEADRYTNPNGDYQTEGSFAHSLYTNYVKPAQDKGVTVILCTPIVRRPSGNEFSNGNLHITADATDQDGNSYAGGDYPAAVKKLGTDLNIPVVDMTSLTKNLYETLGAEETINLHAWSTSNSSTADATHTNIWGAKYNAYMLTQEIKKQNVAGIAEHILTADAPTKADTLKVNPNYKEPEFVPVTGESKLWEKSGIWSGTAFGDLGGAPSTSKQTLETDADGNIHINVKTGGKISSTSDGIAMYYYKVPANSQFTLSAKATVHSYTSHDQVSFGLMARDAVRLDTNTKDPMGDYVAAGPLKLTQAGGVWNCFARKSGELTQGGTCENAVTAGETYELKIESNTDGYACTFGNEKTITGGFDFKLVSLDADYVYVGMFAARAADVTFSDVTLVVDGQVLCGTVETPGGDDTPGTDDNTPGTDDNTPGTDDNTPGTDDNTPGTDDNITYNDLTVSGNMQDAAISSNAVAQDASGASVPTDSVKLVVDAELEETQVADIEQTLVKENVVLKENAKKAYYDISLQDNSGNKVELKNGSIRLTFAYPAGLDQTLYDFSVYHIKKDGNVEKLESTAAESGVVVETTGLSPFVLVYEAKETPTTPDSSVPSQSVDQNTNKSEVPSAGGNVNTEKTDNAEAAKDTVATGDTAGTLGYVLLLMAAMAVLGYELYRKRNVLTK